MISASQYPALVLNADFQPLSIHPLSVLPWQKAVRKVMLGRLETIAEYDVTVSSAAIRLPSVVRVRNYVRTRRRVAPNRMNIWLRDGGRCVYCQCDLPTSELTFDHVIPRSKGGPTTLDNISSACLDCNMRKADRTPKEAGMIPTPWPHEPSQLDLAKAAIRLGKAMPVPRDWRDYLYWQGDLES